MLMIYAPREKWQELSRKLGMSENLSKVFVKTNAEVQDLHALVLQIFSKIREVFVDLSDKQYHINNLNAHATGDGGDHAEVAHNTNKLFNIPSQFYAGGHTTVGGSASEDIAITGVLASMRCVVTLSAEGSVPVSITQAVCANGKITITFSADPQNDHQLNYLVF